MIEDALAIHKTLQQNCSSGYDCCYGSVNLYATNYPQVGENTFQGVCVTEQEHSTTPVGCQDSVREMDMHPNDEIREKYLADVELLVKHANRTIGQGREMIGWLRVLESEFGLSVTKSRSKLQEGLNELVRSDSPQVKEVVEEKGGDIDGEDEIEEGEYTFANILQRNKSSKRKLRRWRQAALEAINEISTSVKRTSVFEMTPGVLKEAVKEYRTLNCELEHQRQITKFLEEEKTKLEEENAKQELLIRELLSNPNGIRIPINAAESDIPQEPLVKSRGHESKKLKAYSRNSTFGCGTSSTFDDLRDTPSPPCTQHVLMINSSSVKNLDTNIFSMENRAEGKDQHNQENNPHTHHLHANNCPDHCHGHNNNNGSNSSNEGNCPLQGNKKFVVKALTVGIIASLMFTQRKR